MRLKFITKFSFEVSCRSGNGIGNYSFMNFQAFRCLQETLFEIILLKFEESTYF